ncbi:MAG: hypothetical protein JO202_04545, partial [Ktedonobacteraceae bacterium]|nr:hypothetical protein [Ktedonobacteraceae bacterium]
MPLVAPTLETGQLLRTYRTLVIIDNYETIHDSALKIWIEDIPEPSKVLITSRASDWRKITSITLQGLEDSEALELIRSHSSRRRLPTLAVTSEEQLLPLIRVTAGNPQAIIMALGHIEVGELSLTEVIEDLSLAKSTVDDIFSYLFEESWKHIREDTKRVLMVVPFFANIMSQRALATAAGLSNFRVRAAVEQLTQLMLLDIQQEQIVSIQSYSVHPLTRAFAQTQLGSSPEYEQEARARWSDYYVKFARDHLIRGKQDDRYWSTLVRSGGAMQIDREWLNLLNVLEWADHTKQQQVLIDLVLLLAHYMNRHFHYNEYNERLYYARKAALAAKILNDLESAALLRIDTLGWTLIEKKRLEEAEQEITMGLSIAQTLHPVNPHTIDLLALAHIFLARVFLEQGLLKKAEISMDQATALDSRPVV